jgi:hypothetical protein
MTAARGLTAALLSRNKIWILVIAAYMSIFSSLLAARGLSGIPAFPLGIGFVLTAFAYLGLLGIFVSPEADLASMKSSYPAHLFVLPVRTSLLALLPMVCATLIVAPLCFMVIAASRHAGTPIDLYWMTFLCAAIVAMLQAIFWFPIGFPYSKLILTLVLIPGSAASLAIARVIGWSETTVCWILGAVILTSYGSAYVGLVKARRGDSRSIDVDEAAAMVSTRNRRPKMPFGSAFRAQCWYEWRQNGLILPAILIIAFALMCALLFWNDTLTPITPLRTHALTYVTPSVRLDQTSVPTAPTLLLVYYPLLLGLIPLAAWMIGCGAKRTAVKRGDQSLHLFYATRPLSNWRLAHAKFRTAAKTVLVSLGVLLIFSIPLLFVNGGHQVNYGRMDDGLAPLYQILAPYLTIDLFLHVGAVVVLIAFAAWRNYVVGMWTEISGKLWLRYAYPIGLILGITAACAHDAFRTPGDGSWLTYQVVTIGAWVAVVAKLLAAVFLLRKQVKEGALTAYQVLIGGLAFCGTAAVMGCLALFSTESIRFQVEAVDTNSFTWINWLILGCVILWTPINRILLAPMMLGINRHRA